MFIYQRVVYWHIYGFKKKTHWISLDDGGKNTITKCYIHLMFKMSQFPVQWIRLVSLSRPTSDGL